MKYRKLLEQIQLVKQEIEIAKNFFLENDVILLENRVKLLELQAKILFTS